MSQTYIVSHDKRVHHVIFSALLGFIFTVAWFLSFVWFDAIYAFGVAAAIPAICVFA